jgi:uncharacterized protein with HEPN domain
MNPKSNKYLYDILNSINSIEEFLGTKRDFFEYQNNKMLKRAIERELEIIGEATNRLLKLNPELILEHSRRIIDTRNFIIHGYDKIDDVIIWGIVSKYIPLLKNEVSELLEKKSD